MKTVAEFVAAFAIWISATSVWTPSLKKLAQGAAVYSIGSRIIQFTARPVREARQKRKRPARDAARSITPLNTTSSIAENATIVLWGDKNSGGRSPRRSSVFRAGQLEPAGKKGNKFVKLATTNVVTARNLAVRTVVTNKSTIRPHSYVGATTTTDERPPH